LGTRSAFLELIDWKIDPATNIERRFVMFRCLVALSQAHPSGSPAAAASEETTEGENRPYLVMQSFTGTGGGAKTVDL
jgi:hypothetical protein